MAVSRASTSPRGRTSDIGCSGSTAQTICRTAERSASSGPNDGSPGPWVKLRGSSRAPASPAGTSAVRWSVQAPDPDVPDDADNGSVTTLVSERPAEGSWPGQ